MRIAVFYGGPGPERPVSLKSGDCVARALTEAGHEVGRFDVTAARLPADYRPADWGVVFLALHGIFGEDGQIQALLDRAGARYTGSDALASQCAMNKLVAKRIFLRARIMTPAYEYVSPRTTPRELARHLRALGFPLIVKPVSGGSSLGLSLVRGPEEVAPALARVFALDDDALLEDFIPGAELTVGVLEDRALGLIEMTPSGELFDYDAKYQAGRTAYLVDPPLAPLVRHRLYSEALRAHRVLGCGAFSRVDLRLAPWGDAYVLEVNTLPGMTETSLLPKIAQSRGLSFAALCERLCALARPALRQAC